MKINELMNLNIQLFADAADNDSADVNNTVDAEVAAGEEDGIVVLTDNSEDVVTEVSNNNTNDEGAADPESDSKGNNEDVTQTQAFARRLKEEKTKMQQENQAKLDNFAQQRGFKDWKELEQANEREQLDNLGINDQDAFNKFLEDKINNNPVVLEAKKVLEQQKNAEIEKALNNEISLISEMDPSIKSLDDLAQIPEYDELMDKAVNRGYSLSDAFKVVAFNRIQTKAINESKQSAIDNINSKSHMKTTSGKGGNEVFVPADVMASYRKNMPEMTEEEIKKDYAKFLKGGN